MTKIIVQKPRTLDEAYADMLSLATRMVVCTSENYAQLISEAREMYVTLDEQAATFMREALSSCPIILEEFIQERSREIH